MFLQKHIEGLRLQLIDFKLRTRAADGTTAAAGAIGIRHDPSDSLDTSLHQAAHPENPMSPPGTERQKWMSALMSAIES